MMKMGEAAYQADPQAAAGGDAGAGNDEDTVVDAEFEEVDGNTEAGDKK